jgi:pimeloyl-ACP methyl ester carboxylesterase
MNPQSNSGETIPSKFAKGRTAFLVIHGIGEQNPFETLDSFTRGFVRYMQTRQVPFTATHKVADRVGAGGAHWTESFVRLSSADSLDCIDIHEYYWAYITEEQISPGEVCKWVQQALAGAINSYEQNEELRKNHEGEPRPYWWRLLSILRWLRYWYWFVRLLLFFLPGWNAFRSIRGKIEKFATHVIVGYLGDIAIYTTTDEKSRYYKIRQRILVESQALLEAILAEEEYDRVILAGHSLGSVIAYDTLNRLNIKANLPGSQESPLKKLAGLITFGSPLDKIVFFFREHPKEEQCIRRQIMEHLHSFRSKWTYDGPDAKKRSKQDEVKLENAIEAKLNGIRWVNFYDDKDPISGHLDYYSVDENVPLDLHMKWGLAHMGYWDFDGFYNGIAERFIWDLR